MMTDEEKVEYDQWLKDFGRCLSDYRRRLGYTQKQTAKIAGLNMRLYSDIEYGCRPITTRTLFKICKRLKMPLPYEQGIGLLTPPF